MIGRQSLWYTLENLSSRFLQLLLSAWLIRQFGAESYGEWVLLLALLGLCSIGSEGIAPGLSLRIQASDGHQEQAQWLTAAMAFAGALAGVCFLAVVVLAGWLLPGNGGLPDADVLWPLMAVQIVCSELAVLLAATLRGIGDYGAAAKTSVVLRLLSTLCLAWVAWIRPSLGLLLLVSAMTAMTQAVCLVQQLRRHGIRVRWSGARGSDKLRRLLDDARWQWLKVGGGLLYGSVDRLLVGHILGTAMLAVYAVCLQLSDPLHRVVAMLTQPLMLWAGRARENGVRLIRYWRAFLLIEIGVVAAGGALLLLAPAILPWWLGDQAESHALVVQLAVVGSTLSALNALAHHVQMGLGQLRRMALANFIGGLVAVIVMALTGTYGLIAVMLSRCLFGLILFTSWPALLRGSREV